MLVPAHLRQFAPAIHQLVLGSHELIVQSFTHRCQLVIGMSLRQQRVEILVEEIAPEVTRAMTAVVTDVERLVTLGSLRQLLVCEVIGVVIAVSSPRIGLELIEDMGVLCPGHYGQQHNEQGSDRLFHHALSL